MTQALDQAVPDRVGRVKEDDGHRILHSRSRVLGGVDGLVLEGDDGVHALAYERARLARRLTRLQVPPDQVDVLALCPAQFLKAGLQRLEGWGNVVRPDVHQTDALDGLVGGALGVRAHSP